MNLIINADDFGLTKGVTLGILDSMEKGIVTETTAMVNGNCFDEGIEEAKRRGIKGIGIHLNLTWGKPVLPLNKVITLINDKGVFKKGYNELGKYSLNEIEMELKAQIERFFASGFQPTHIDGHHHFYGLYPQLMKIVIKLSKEYSLPLRFVNEEYREMYKINNIKTTSGFTSEFYGENVSEERLKEIILKYSSYDTVEIMVHPGYADEELNLISTYNSIRKKELDILTSRQMKAFIKEQRIELIGFKNL